ncbi:CgeB family protein [Salirhabdus sp. Marseille-P4669]|uniref:CgeB family protein n=1 Tax=Salirhabdus sp. Marseille-P4669 TaxID=2042310 RepID=UPI000C7B9A92|nr:glycosyltransferase [Salirhabdus sp. Marseille-P4669]
MESEKTLQTVLERIDNLHKKLDHIDPLITLQNREEILQFLINERSKLNKELVLTKHNEKELLERVQKYERIVQKALTEREKNINYLQNRVTVLEQSFPLYVSKRLKKGVSKPTSLPKELFNVTKAVGGAFKRKVTKKKRKYNKSKVKLPFSMSEVPSLSDKFIVDKEKFINKKVNELFLMGLYNNPKNLKELRIACILDDFSYQAFKYDANLISFKPENWFEVLKTELPHMLLVESAWQGNGGAWQYKIAKYNIDQGSELDELLKWCKQNNIPTIFWNKEDPIHFERFIDTASKFDFIYTSDENCVERYKEVTGNDNVFSLSFAAQPKIHNPIKVPNYKENNICFAGSYYANRHEQRRIEQEKMLEASQRYGLVIFDRNFSKDNVNPHMQYPEKFHENIKGSLPYTELVNAYKQYKLFLNVNSVKNSPTMFSRRVYELLACGTSVLSTDSVGIEKLFGDIIPQVHENDDNEEIIGKIINDNALRKKNELKGIRTVLNNHTYAHRLYKVATSAGFKIEKPYNINVLIMGKVHTADEAKKIKDSFNNQKYVNKNLLLINFSNEVITEESNVSIINAYEDNDDLFSKEDLKNFSEKYDVVGRMSQEHYYGQNFITDIVNGYKYSEADVIGKGSYFTIENNVVKTNEENLQYVYTDSLVDDAFLVKLDVLNGFGIKLNDILNKKYILKDLSQFGLRLFSIDIFNFVRGTNNDTVFNKEDVDL